MHPWKGKITLSRPKFKLTRSGIADLNVLVMIPYTFWAAIIENLSVWPEGK